MLYFAIKSDVAAAVAQGLFTAEDHFNLHGKFEGRGPNPIFDPVFYLAQNPDVAAALKGTGVSAFDHFMAIGHTEARGIHPTINLGNYIAANPDLAEAIAAGQANAFDHLLNHGLSEPRDLGNGVNLGAFANDPVFQAALATGNLTTAAARVADVTPFIPSFNAPANWTPPANLPIPTDFVPTAGEKLVVPTCVKVPEGTKLPDFIDPPKPAPAPVPDSGGGTVVTPFSGKIDDAFTVSGEDNKKSVVMQDTIKSLDSYTLTAGTLDMSGTKGNTGTLDLSKATITGNVIVKLAELTSGNKSDLVDSSGRKSDQTVKLPSLDKLAGANLSIENMTISATASYTKAPVKNDVLKFNDTDFASKVSKIEVQTSSTAAKVGEKQIFDYVDMILTFGTGAETADFTLTLKNVFSENVYNNMLKASDTVNTVDSGLENTLGLVTNNTKFTEGVLYHSHKYNEGTATAFTDTAHIVQLVGILTNEGTFAFEV